MTRLLFSLLIVVLLLTGCRQQSPMPQENSIYYWRTEWRLDSLERDFLKQYDIHKVYCRYFDVVMRNNEPMPNATISFTEPIAPSLSIVPTVYITENCMHSEHKGLAERIVELESRVRTMEREEKATVDALAKILTRKTAFLSAQQKA